MVMLRLNGSGSLRYRLHQRRRCRAAKFFGLRQSLEACLLAGQLVVHVGRNERHRLAGPTGSEQFVAGDFAAADAHQGIAVAHDGAGCGRQSLALRQLAAPGPVRHEKHRVHTGREGNPFLAGQARDDAQGVEPFRLSQ